MKSLLRLLKGLLHWVYSCHAQIIPVLICCLAHIQLLLNGVCFTLKKSMQLFAAIIL